MSRIRLLSEAIANKIAAGEVIERPASVLKELVENSLDAESAAIEIEVRNGGRALLRVADDGVGMDRDDALLCLERHATSKIRDAADIERIVTLGFRGEALPSIAAVSRMTLVTRTRDQAAGTRIRVHGGKIMEVGDWGAPPGTALEVQQLFFNLPARRKFLRSVPTELGHIEHMFVLHALAHPQVAWKLVIDGTVTRHLAPVASLTDRIGELLGGEYLEQMLPVRGAAGPVRLDGFVGRPGFSRSSRREQYLFVNARPIESRALHYALLEGFHTSLMRGRYPIAILFVSLPPEQVDVNIHPAKREVRFRDEWRVRDLVASAVRDALAGAGVTARPSAGRGAEPVETATDATGPGPAELPAPEDALQQGRLLPDRALTGFRRGTFLTEPGSLELGGDPLPIAPLPAAPPAPGRTSPAGPGTAGPPAQAGEAPPLAGCRLRVLGVLANLYVLLEGPDGLLVMDQHAAHERVLFERFLRQMRERGAPSQMLLVPQTIDLDARDSALLRENLATLQALGVGIAEFGDRAFVVESLPPPLAHAPAGRVLRDLLDELQAGGAGGMRAQRLSEEQVAAAACKRAVKAHDPLGPAELDDLVRQLLEADLPYTCPHGRPTLVRVSFAELERRFGRRV